MVAASNALPSAVAVFAILALVVVVVLLLKDKAANGGVGAASVAAPSAAVTAPSDEATTVEDADKGAARSATAFPGAPYFRDPRDAYDPYWLSRPVWGRDLYNRDPVCYGDPACRDAYFRDWPWARRPFSHKPSSSSHSRREPPINISVTAPSTATNTNTNTVQVPPPPPPAAGAEPTLAAPPASEPVLEPAAAPAPEPVPEPVLEPAPEPVLEPAAGRARRGGGCRSCSLNVTTPAASYDAVFPVTMDRSTYAL
jgi:hypothetical protein